MARCACFIYPLCMLEKGVYVSGALCFFDHPSPKREKGGGDLVLKVAAQLYDLGGTVSTIVLWSQR